MLERLVITAIVLLCLAALYQGWGWYKGRLLQTIAPRSGTLKKPTLLYFTADYCAPCRLQQTPIIEQLMARIGGAATVQKIDVTQSPEMASQYKVMTLPTTVILNGQGQAIHINYGVTPQETLEGQLL